MYSSYTPEDFNNIEEDIFGEYTYSMILINYIFLILYNYQNLPK